MAIFVDFQNVGDIQAVTSNPVTVHIDLKMFLAGRLLDGEIFNAAHVRHRVTNLIAEVTQRVLIFAKNLDGNLRVDSRDQFIVTGLNHLREIELHTGKAFDAAAHGVHQFIFGFRGGPLFLRFQTHVESRHC